MIRIDIHEILLVLNVNKTHIQRLHYYSVLLAHFLAFIFLEVIHIGFLNDQDYNAPPPTNSGE